MAVPRATVQAFPRTENGVPLGELLQGTALVKVAEGDGFVRVRIEGYVATTQLAAVQHAGLPGGPEVAPAPPPTSRERGPLTDLSRAHHLDVACELVPRATGRVVVVALTMRSADGREVAVAGSRHGGSVRVFRQRRIAGGLARGDELLSREVTFADGRATLELPLAEVGDPAPPLVLFSARVELAPGRELVGAASEVVLPER